MDWFMRTFQWMGASPEWWQLLIVFWLSETYDAFRGYRHKHNTSFFRKLKYGEYHEA